MTFLELGSVHGGHTYVRAAPAELADYFVEPFRPHLALPSAATDSGLRRGHSHLWLAADRSVAYVGSRRSDVEQWPATVKELGCA
jgi:hypothetical protein